MRELGPGHVDRTLVMRYHRANERHIDVGCSAASHHVGIHLVHACHEILVGLIWRWHVHCHATAAHSVSCISCILKADRWKFGGGDRANGSEQRERRERKSEHLRVPSNPVLLNLPMMTRSMGIDGPLSRG